MKSAGKARNNGIYRHIRTSKEIIRNLLNDLLKNKNIGVNPVLYKSNVWEYEKEWRMFDYASNFEEGKDFMVLKDAITAIYLGACMKEDEEDRVRRWAKKKEIVVYKMKLDDETYKLTCKNI